jgi:hypothetical protein
MVEPVTAAAVAAAVLPYLVSAVEAFGQKVLERTADAAADEAAGFGARLLGRLLRRDQGGAAEDAQPAGTHASGVGREAAVAEAVRDLAAAPADEDARAVLRVAVRKLLEDDPELREEVAGALRGAPAVAVGERAIVIGQQSGGVNVAGDGNDVSYHPGR